MPSEQGGSATVEALERDSSVELDTPGVDVAGSAALDSVIAHQEELRTAQAGLEGRMGRIEAQLDNVIHLLSNASGVTQEQRWV